MSKPSPLIQRQFPVGFVLVQGGVVLGVAFVAWQFFGDVAGKSAAIGAFIGWLASGYATWKSFRFGGNGQLMLASFYQGVIGKFVIVIAGFFIAFHTIHPLSASALFAGFVVIQTMAWIYPVWLGQRLNQS